MIFKRTIAVVALTFSACAAFADDCSVTVNSNDRMQYDTKLVEISKSCTDFTVVLNHTGKMPAAAMGHNWVLTKAADARSVATAGISAGLANNYLKVGDARVIAATKIIGGGESTSVTFPVSKLSDSEAYKFFCSFPGHIGVMIGDVKLK
ncbi:MAG: azurin [Proteobacteria bacterium]|nr:MAG: azurin [Pseudomonadota bacterium]PIE40267.1 MAG: azurin [Gammaproteobacteria bacterium]